MNERGYLFLMLIEMGKNITIADFKAKAIEIYLDLANNFLSIKGFADHYGMTGPEAICLIDYGRITHDAQFLSINN